MSEPAHWREIPCPDKEKAEELARDLNGHAYNRLNPETNLPEWVVGRFFAPADDGGQAFPAQPVFSPEMGTIPGWNGMSLRDWYAGQALTGLCASGINGMKFEVVTDEAWTMAKSMMASREKLLKQEGTR